jgi:flagellar biosynthesis chaperone FliJ
MQNETGMNIKASNRNTATVRDVYLLGNKVWNSYKELHKQDFTDKDELFDKLAEMYKEFVDTYPQIVNIMVYQNEYDKKVFKRFLNKLKKKPWETQEEKVGWFAEYAAMLYAHVNKGRVTKKMVAKYKKDQEQKLLSQYKDYKSNIKNTATEIEQKYDDLDKDRVDEIFEMLKTYADEDTLLKVKKLYDDKEIGRNELEYIISGVKIEGAQPVEVYGDVDENDEYYNKQKIIGEEDGYPPILFQF